MDKRVKQPNSTHSLDKHTTRLLVDSKRPSISGDIMKQIDEVNSALYISDYGAAEVQSVSQQPRSKTGTRSKGVVTRG